MRITGQLQYGGFPYGSTGCSAGSTKTCDAATAIPTRRCPFALRRWFHLDNLLSKSGDSSSEFNNLIPPVAEQEEED